MDQYKKLNSYIGWLVFAIATCVYLITMEKTASLWDCGEFVAGAYKLQVVHAPGAPLFLMLGKVFSLFASDPSQVALMVNSMSALASSFTILFLFWTITAFGKKIYSSSGWAAWYHDGKIDQSKIIIILGAGVVGSLAYTFSDSFWFSAVEGEVYALSSFFTAVTFWCILKWEEAFGKPHANKWLVLISFLIGLSIGVHLLSLLTIPAISLIWGWKTFKPESLSTSDGIGDVFKKILGPLAALAGGSVLLFILQGIVIPGTASLMGIFDKFFVNSLWIGFNSGAIFFIFLIFALLASGIYYTQYIANSPTINTVLVCILFLFIGYSSYTSVMIRSSANTPINIGAPSDPLSLSSYLQRDQYGDWPVFSGNYYYAAKLRGENTDSVYAKVNNRYKGVSVDYEIIYPNENEQRRMTRQGMRLGRYIDGEEKSRLFPRMWSDQKTSGYNRWRQENGYDLNEPINFAQNLHFFIDYQIGWSYMRYFHWNFSGRQNDIQNMDQNPVYGNYEGGVKNLFTKQNETSKHLSDNKGKNHYYYLPLLLGLIGVFFQFITKPSDAFSVLLFFLFTGVLIIFFLNVPPDQPRERDYAYVGSFYAFSIWIGLGVIGIFHFINLGIKTVIEKSKKISTIYAIVCFLLTLGIPALMASENWDDHDRSHRTIAIDIAKNYLEHLEDNALIFTNGDNDTYPLWYAQEVENIKLNSRVVNMSLLGMDWYIDQIKWKQNEADPVPSSLTNDHYLGNNYQQIAVVNRFKNKEGGKYINAKRAINLINKTKQCPRFISIPIDPNNFSESDIENWGDKNILKEIRLQIKGRLIYQHEVALLDILANFDFKRPLYFINAPQTLDRFIMVGKQPRTPQEMERYLGLLNYIQEEGAVTRLVPFKVPQENKIDLDKSFDLLVNKYRYGGIPNGLNYQTESNVYYDYYTSRSMYGFRIPFLQTAQGLIASGDTSRAIQLANKYFETFPISTDILDPTSVEMAKIYVDAQYNEGYYWVENLLNEYNLQAAYLQNLETNNNVLNGDAQRLKDFTKRNVNQLKNIQKFIDDPNYVEKFISEGVMIDSIINKGNGKSTSIGDRVKVHYTGRLLDGTKFDSSVDRGDPFEFIIGARQVIAGWDETLQKMKVGDKWVVRISPEKGYGSQNMGSIPPNSTLIFEIELIEIIRENV